MNWNRFFLRLTMVVSIIAFIIMAIIGHEIWHHSSTWILDGLLGSLIIWGLYFGIRWTYNGLKE